MSPAKTITLEQSYTATLEEVWELWTTPAGMEAWWGPEGFTTKVLELQPVAGGKLHYTMTATGKEQVAFMKQAGMPLTSETRGRYTEVKPMSRLVLVQVADFIPGVAPYDLVSRVDFKATGKTVKMTVTIDEAHDAVWTERQKMGWESQLARLAKRFAK